LDPPGLAVGGLDLDGARLHRLGHLAGEVDMEQPVLDARGDHLDVVGEAEPTLEGALGDTAMQVRPLLRVALLIDPAGDHQVVLLGADLEVALTEAGHRHRDAVLVLAGLLDVVGRVGGHRVGRQGV
jgi:hypothetical protein